jgi:hypothetical protein
MIRNLELIENFSPRRLGMNNHECERLEEIGELANFRIRLILLWNRMGEWGPLRHQTKETHFVGGKTKLVLPKLVIILMKPLELGAGVVFVGGSWAMEPADGAEIPRLFEGLLQKRALEVEVLEVINMLSAI